MGSKKTETKSMPQFQQDFLEGTVIPFAQDFLAKDYQSYEGDRVAGMTPLGEQAMTGYGALNMGAPSYGQAADAYAQLATMDAPTMQAAQIGNVGSIADANMANYMSPYTDAVIESGLRDLGGAQEMALNQHAARLRGAGAAGLGSIAGQQLQSSLAGLGAQTAAGEAQRALGQAGLDAQFQDFMAAQNYPLTQFGVLTGAAGAIPQGYGTFTTRTGGLGPALGALGSVGMGFGMAGMGPLAGLQGSNMGFNPFSFN